jgi:hypothetical protein
MGFGAPVVGCIRQSTYDAIICYNLLAGWKLPMNSFEKMLGWFPHTSREWIELIIMTVLLWLLMMAIFELELGSSVS